MNFFRAVRIVLCDTIVVDTQPLHNCPQNIKQQEGPSPPKAGDRLWGIGVTCQCRSIHCDEWTTWAGGEDREAGAQLHKESLYLLLDFAVNLKMLLKKKNED